jgi:hypothetical protein
VVSGRLFVAFSPPLNHALSVVFWTWARLIPLLVVAHCPDLISFLMSSSSSGLLLALTVVVTLVQAAKRVVSFPPWVASLRSF